MLTRRFGRRGVALGLMGCLWLLIGTGFAAFPQPRFSRDGTEEGPLQFLDDITTPWLGMIWIAGGAAALLCALVRNRLPRDDYGFVGLAVPTVAWSTFYLWSWLEHLLVPGFGRATAWIPCVVYIAVTAFVLFIARWPDPDDPHLRSRRGMA